MPFIFINSHTIVYSILCHFMVGSSEISLNWNVNIVNSYLAFAFSEIECEIKKN